VQRFELLADDQFGAAATDVDDQALPAHIADVVRNAEIDQAGLLVSGDDLDLVPEHAFSTRDEFGAVARLPQSVGTDDAQARGRNVTYALPEAGQAGERPLLRGVRQAVAFVESGGKLDHFAQPVEDLHTTVLDARDDHVEAV